MKAYINKRVEKAGRTICHHMSVEEDITLVAPKSTVLRKEDKIYVVDHGSELERFLIDTEQYEILSLAPCPAVEHLQRRLKEWLNRAYSEGVLDPDFDGNGPEPMARELEDLCSGATTA